MIYDMKLKNSHNKKGGTGISSATLYTIIHISLIMRNMCWINVSTIRALNFSGVQNSGKVRLPINKL